MKHQPQLTLIGAGPGDPELITLKGATALGKADAVLYDALVNPDLLDLAPANAPKVFVGKRKSDHAYSQAEINQLIVDLAKQYGHVVRLKGGDPFVFGRGHEEMTFAANNHIPATYIPGISSSIGVAGLQGIPVTNRGISESFWVITGTTSDGNLSKDVSIAATTNATVVILMGVSRLADIVNLYQQKQQGQKPIALIQNGSLNEEKIALGTIDTIELEVIKQGIGAPAIIVIGEVVQLHPNFLAAIQANNLTVSMNQ